MPSHTSSSSPRRKEAIARIPEHPEGPGRVHAVPQKIIDHGRGDRPPVRRLSGALKNNTKIRLSKEQNSSAQ